MNSNPTIQQLQREIGKTTCDAKAEALLALALEKGISSDDFLVSCDSLFYREYNKDVVSTDIKEDARKLSLLQLHLSRSGVYDHLPEGMFFQPASVQPSTITAADMALDYKQNKQKEADARRLFLPFENDFFWQRLQLEMEESRLLEGLQSGILNDFFMQFWGIPSSIPAPLVVSLILLLPYVHRIAGNLSLTAACLEELLQETVRVNKVTAGATGTQSLLSQSLGSRQLGADMACGERFMEDYPVLQFTIGPLQHSQVADYLEGGKYMEFLETFYGFFVPAEAGTITNIEVPEVEKGMQMQSEKGVVLGYSSVL